MDLLRQSVTGLRALLVGGEISPADIAEAVVERTSRADPAVGAYQEFYAEELLANAAEATRLNAYRSPPLGGIPVAVKDNICVKGRAVTCGSRILAGYTSPYSATGIERLCAAGALLTGRTRCDEFAMGSSSENCAYGPVKNPWDTTRVPGGSSGGSAAAVAAGMVPAALGSDTGGSIRQPAAFCGVVGLKPTWGRVSRYGLVAFASSFDQIGPIARRVADTALLLSILSGGDARDSTCLPDDPADYTTGLDGGAEKIRVGVPARFLEGALDETVAAAFERLSREMRSAGVEVTDVEMPHLEYALPAYYVIANAEASANLARFDGVRYGYRPDEPRDIDALYVRSRGGGFGDEVKRRILLGTFVLSAGYYDDYYVRAQAARSMVRADFEAAFSTCDLLMLPTAPTPAFTLGEKANDPLAMYRSDVLTIPASLAGLPAVSLPAGLAPGRLPVGVQLVAPAREDHRLLRAAARLERMIGFREAAYG